MTIFHHSLILLRPNISSSLRRPFVVGPFRSGYSGPSASSEAQENKGCVVDGVENKPKEEESTWARAFKILREELHRLSMEESRPYSEKKKGLAVGVEQKQEEILWEKVKELLSKKKTFVSYNLDSEPKK